MLEEDGRPRLDPPGSADHCLAIPVQVACAIADGVGEPQSRGDLHGQCRFHAVHVPVGESLLPFFYIAMQQNAHPDPSGEVVFQTW